MKTVQALHYRVDSTSIASPAFRMAVVQCSVTPSSDGRWDVGLHVNPVIAIRCESDRCYAKDIPFGSPLKKPSQFDTKDDLYADGWRFEKIYVREVPVA